MLTNPAQPHPGQLHAAGIKSCRGPTGAFAFSYRLDSPMLANPHFSEPFRMQNPLWLPTHLPP
jgi:hypothetical protein